MTDPAEPLSPPGVDRRDTHEATGRKPWVAILLISAAVCVAASIPYLAGWYAQTPELRYAWVGVKASDNLSYFAKISQGRQGEWLFHLPYTAQTHDGIPIYTYYLLLGHISRWLALPIPFVFHLARVLNGFILLVVVYVFIRQLTEIERERRFILTLVAISAGLGWLAASAGIQSSDLTISESITFYTLMDNPHFPLSQTLLLLLALSYLPPPPADKRRLIGGYALVALASIVLASLQPHMLAIAWGIGTLYCAWLWWDTRSVPRAPFMRLVVSLVFGGAVVGMIALSLNSNPLVLGMSAQDLTLSPPIISYISGYILLLIPAVFGARWALRARPQAAKLMIVWCVITLVALYAPTTIQRRFISGVHVPIAILAGLGICRVWMPRWHTARRWAWAYLTLAGITSAVLVLVITRVTLAHTPDFFLSTNESQALEWLEDHAKPDGVVLSSPELGAFVPAFTSQRVVVGHWAETVDFAGTAEKVKRMYATAADSTALCAALTQWGVSYVLVGPREQRIGANEQDFAQAASLTQVAHYDDVSIYRVDCPSALP